MVVALLATGLACSCVSSGQRELEAELARAGEGLAALEPVRGPVADRVDEAPEAAPDFDGSPEAYVNYALAHQPGLRAKWERWRAASHRVARERRMPMPSLTYTGFVSTIETRVGPQRHRLSLRQRFPWPGELLAGADAATAAARVEQRVFEAAALELRAQVLGAYWQLWLVREVETIEREELELFDALLELARVRLEVGGATLADVQQLELRRSWLQDGIESLVEREHSARVRLLGAVSAELETEAPTLAELPLLELPTRDDPELREALADHPALGRYEAAAAASELRVKEARHARAPGLSLGVDWIEVGPARTEGVAGSGKDALSLSVGLELPLWQGNYAEDQRAAQAEAAAARADWSATHDRVSAQLGLATSRIRDTARRVKLHETTLIPQAETALEATLGGYQTGKVPLAAILMAERDLLDLRVEIAELHAAHAHAWAELEAIVGRGVEGGPA